MDKPVKHAAERHLTGYTLLDSPIGSLLLGGDGETVMLIGFPGGSMAVSARPDWYRDDGLYAVARSQIAAWFAGQLQRFDFPMTMIGTPFQKMVWQALIRIPFGKTATYGQIAQTLGKPGAARAVGTANRCNPLPIMVPCHRVIGADWFPDRLWRRS